VRLRYRHCERLIFECVAGFYHFTATVVTIG
jgi:hypothetical protein